MKKTIAIMLMFATGCMSLAGCAETEVTVVTESIAAEETPDGETYLSSSIEYAVFGDNECKSYSYHYDHDELIGYTEYEYYSAGRRSSITSYHADGTVVYTNVCEYEYLDA